FVGWVRANVGRRGPEVDEIIGYHLEQAYRCRSELGSADTHTRALATEAGELLASAGRRAIARDDLPAAGKLLERATHLLDERSSARLLPDIGSAHAGLGELARGLEILDEAIARAREFSDPRLEASALIERTLIAIHAQGDIESLAEIATRVTAIFERAQDEEGLARAWRLRGIHHFVHSSYGEMDRALERAARHARNAGDHRLERTVIGGRALAAVLGPTPAVDAIALCQEIQKEAASNPVLKAIVTAQLGELEG